MTEDKSSTFPYCGKIRDKFDRFEEYIFGHQESEVLLQKEARIFVQKELKPISDSVQGEITFLANQDSPLRRAFWQAVKKMQKAGYTALGLPEEYGGIPCSSKEQAIFTQEVCSIDGAIGLSVGASLSLVAFPILLFGTTEQKQKWLPKIAAGEVLGCYAQTEEKAGSDVKNIKTKAWQDKNGQWRINGNKIFITNGSEAGVAIVIARVNPEPHKGLAAFLVDLEQQKKEGLVQILRNENKAGLHLSPTTALSFEGAAAELLGDLAMLDSGWHIAMTTLTSSRATVIPAQGIGIAQGAEDIILPYTKSRLVFELPVCEFPANTESLAQIRTMIEMAKLLCFRACFLKDVFGAENYRFWQQEASVAKRFGAEIARQIPSLAIQLAGGIGYMMDFRLAKFWHDGQIVGIYEGTDRVQELIIAESMGKRMKAVASKGKLAQGLWWVYKHPWIVNIPEEESLFRRLGNSPASKDLLKLRKRFSAQLFKAAWKHLPSKEDFTHNRLPLVWHKLAWALCVLEGAKLLLGRAPYQSNSYEDRIAIYLAEEALNEAGRVLHNPAYEKAILQYPNTQL